MPGSRLEAAVSAMISRARLYEHVVHNRGAWGAIARSAGQDGRLVAPMALERHECGDRIVLTGYVSSPLPAIVAIDLWCGGVFLDSWPVDPPQDGPVRITLDVGIEDSELAA